MLEKSFAYGSANPHPLSQMRTELVWDGKYDEYGRRRDAAFFQGFGIHSIRGTLTIAQKTLKFSRIGP